MLGIILSAGVSNRLRPHTENKPKCLLDINGTTILERQIESLKKAGINKFIVVTGYYSNQIFEFIHTKYGTENFNMVNNSIYRDSNNGYSLYLALREKPVHEPFILLNGDVVCHPDLIKEVVNSNYFDCLSIQKKKEWNQEDMKVIFDAETKRVKEVSKTIPDNGHPSYEFTGIAKFTDINYMSSLMSELSKEENIKEWFEKSLNKLINEQKINLFVHDVTHYPSIEIDFSEDLEIARDIFPAFNTADWEWGIRHKSLEENKRNSADAVKLLDDMTYVLRKHGIKHWLNWGLLLGFYRDKQFIPWDTDIDVTFHKEDETKIKSLVIPEMKALGCFIPKPENCEEGDFWFIRDKEKIELNSVQSIGDKYIYSPGRCDLGCPKEYIDTLAEIEVYGKKWPVPSNTENYLRLSYGENWKTPIRYTGDNYYDCKPKSL